MNYILRIATVIAVLPMLSCEHKGVTNSLGEEVEVKFDWKNAPDAKPETMRLYLFPVGSGSHQVYEFVDYRGGTVKMPEGQYKAICVNSDTEKVLYRNVSSFDEFEAYAPDGTLNVSAAPRSKATSIERVATSPDCLYSATLDEFTVKLGKKNQSITLCPSFTVWLYKVTITNVTNLKYTASDGLFGCISGMSGGLYVGLEEPTDEVVTVPFETSSDGVSTVTADFIVYGSPDSKSSHEITIYALMSDGNNKYYTFDVTNQVNNARDPHNVSISLSGLELPKPIVNGSGFHPDVSDWENIDVDIPM